MPIIRKSDEFDKDFILQNSQKLLFYDYKLTKIPSRRYEIIKISKDRTSIKLIDKNQGDLLSIIVGQINFYHNKEYFEIIGSYSKQKRCGHLTYLFEFIIYELKFIILSDSQHSSPGSKEFWQSLIKRKKFNIYRINIKTNYKRKAIKFMETEIWKKFIKNPIFTNIDYLNILEENNPINEEFENEILENFTLEEIDPEIERII